MDLVEKDSEVYPILSLFLVRMTGFPPVAALADKQSFRLFGPADKLLCNFLPISNPTILVKQKGHTRGHVLFVWCG